MKCLSFDGKDACVAKKVVASQFLGVRLFWKVSGLSKRLLALREDATLNGLGSIDFDPVSEREDVWYLIDNVFRAQARLERKSRSSSFSALKTVDLSVLWEFLSGRYPSLLTRVLDKHPSSQEVPDFLGGRDKDSTGAGPLRNLSEAALSSLPGRRLSVLLRTGEVMSPNAWVQVTFERRVREMPMLVAFLAVGNMDCAEVLLDASARVDVCEWWGTSPRRAGRTPMEALLEFLVRAREKGEEGVEKRQQGLRLLRRLAEASQRANCLGWELRSGLWWGAGKTAAIGVACILGDADAIRVLREVHHSTGAAAGDRMEVADLPFLAVSGWDDIIASRSLPVANAEQRADVVKALGDLIMTEGCVNKVRISDGHSPLSLAVSLDLSPVVEALIDLGARCFPTRPDAPPPSPTEPHSSHSLPSPSHGSPPSHPEDPPPKFNQISALRVACEAADPELVHILCERGRADPNAPGKRWRGRSDKTELPLWAAVRAAALARNRDIPVANVVKTLHKFGADMSLIPPPTVNLTLVTASHTPLTYALSGGFTQTARALCEDTYLRDQTTDAHMRNPLIDAMASQAFSHTAVKMDLLRLMLEKGADPNQHGLIEIRVGPDKTRQLSFASPLQAALLFPQLDQQMRHAAVKLLIDHGARCPPPTETPSLASFASSEEAASPPSLHPPSSPTESQSESLPAPSPSSEDAVAPLSVPVCQVSPLHMACTLAEVGQNEKPDLIRLLCLEGGADPNAPGRARQGDDIPEVPLVSVLCRASEQQQQQDSSSKEQKFKKAADDEDIVPVLAALLDGGADPNALAANGRSPLSLARSFKFKNCVRLLFESGAEGGGVWVSVGKRGR
uniref:Uncharacterized protein n=1 Tax=Chromera velia CCMP2878 TaxID=1169474 RepID=A0A0G4GF70_9ALVE|eukprot:Cvel_21621.t1-p1 / transcript=Cvel_21621.t1 / gene=Cvel_21621 / organism=Chromera_velia_CCMP2878 / gene_product=hypothetical protein / transcript_product=hypothetical protein / location=Cvel_scaffold2043:15067-17610(-) / protein_length=848 / sequence_SO=supercontig / SO=protein_coding / is_pseudo=false